MARFFLVLLASLPPLFYIKLYKFKTPSQVIIYGFLGGLFSCLSLIIFKSLLLPEAVNFPSKETLTTTLFISFIEAGLLEEIFKNIFFVLGVKLLNNKNKFDFDLNPYFYVVLGASVGLGFGIFENVSYALNPELGFLNNIWGRLYTTIPAHMIMNIIFSFLYAQRQNLFICLSGAVLFHAIYDFFALPSNLLGDILVRGTLVFGFGLIIYMGKTLINKSEDI